MDKKISVCLASYNGEKYIREQLASILKQLKENDEIIVSDDGSTDCTLDVVRSFHDGRIKIYTNQGEHGYTKNFENALNHAEGDYIFISDQDDVWRENKVERCLEALKDHELVIHDAAMTDENLKVTAPSHFAKYHVEDGFWKTFLRTRYTGACMAFTRNFMLKRVLPFPKNQKYCPYDYWLAYLGLYYKEAIVLHESLIFYRRHEGTALNAGEYSTRTLWERIYTRVYCMKEVLKRK